MGESIIDILDGFVAFKEKGTSVIMCHIEPELKKLQRTGVIAVDKNMKVLECRRSLRYLCQIGQFLLSIFTAKKICH